MFFNGLKLARARSIMKWKPELSSSARALNTVNMGKGPNLEVSYDLDHFHHSSCSMVAGLDWPRWRRVDPPVAGRCGNRSGHQPDQRSPKGALASPDERLAEQG